MRLIKVADLRYKLIGISSLVKFEVNYIDRIHVVDNFYLLLDEVCGTKQIIVTKSVNQRIKIHYSQYKSIDIFMPCIPCYLL